MKLYNSEEIPIPQYGEVFLFRAKSDALLYYKKNSGLVEKLQFNDGVYLISDKTVVRVFNYTDEIIDSTIFSVGIIIRFSNIPNIIVGGGGGSRGAQGASGSNGSQGAQGAQGASAVPVTTNGTLTGDGSGGSPLGLSYKVYTAFIQQSGTNPPTVTIFGANTIGNIVYTRNAPGDYTGTLTGAFPAGKTWMIIGCELDSFFFLGRNDDNTISIITNNFPTDNTVDNLLYNNIEIRVYP